MLAANANTSTEFRRCQPKTAQWEGGWSNHKADPGGKTMYGVTQVKFDEWNDRRGVKRRSVATITRAEAEQLFFDEFWMKAGCENLFPGVNLATYDASVNSGVSRGRKWLVASLSKNNDHVKTVKGLCARRLGFMQSLNIWKTFGKGWGNRVADIEATGVAWALLAMSANDNADVVQHLDDEAAAAKKKAATQIKAGGVSGGAGAGSGGGLALDPSAVNPSAGYVLGGLVVVGLALGAYLVIRAVINRQRSAAYARASASASISGAV